MARAGCKNIVLPRFAAQSAGRTADHDSHGKPTSGRIINVDELVLCYICWRKKAKLGMGWAMRTWVLLFFMIFTCFGVDLKDDRRRQSQHAGFSPRDVPAAFCRV